MIQSTESRMLALDGLRAISILLVMISHAWLGHIVPGGFGVTIFFFISGFIITRIMIAEWDRNGSLCISKFYLRRFFRLIPTLLGFILFAAIIMQLANMPMQATELISVLLYFANYYGIFVGYSSDALPSLLSITWSLAIEEHFYIIFPMMFALLIRIPRRFFLLVATLLLLILIWRLYLTYFIGLENLQYDRINKSTDTRADSIMYGTAFSIIQARYPSWANWLANSRTAILGAVLVLGSLVIRDEGFRESIRYSIQGIGIAFLFSSLVLQSNYFSRLLTSSPLVYVGKISYSLYLYHWLVYGVITCWLSELSLAIKLPLMIVASFICADLSYRWIEKPFLRVGRRFSVEAQ